MASKPYSIRIASKEIILKYEKKSVDEVTLTREVKLLDSDRPEEKAIKFSEET